MGALSATGPGCAHCAPAGFRPTPVALRLRAKSARKAYYRTYSNPTERMEVPFVAKQATAEKRQRRERGSINPDDIIKGAFELAEDVGIDNLSMPLLGKHLGVGVTSIYWYFRKKDDLLNAMTDRALSQYVFATPYVEAQGLARDVGQPRAHHAKDVPGQPDSVRPDSHPVSAEPAGRQAGRAGGREGDRQPGRGRPVAGGRLRHLLRGVGARARIGRAAAALRQEQGADDGAGDFEETMVVDAGDRAAARTGRPRRATASARPTTTTSSSASNASSTTQSG